MWFKGVVRPALIAAVLAAYANSPALAGPDGAPASQPKASTRALNSYFCGTLYFNKVVTQNAERQTASISFTNLNGAVITINVDGETLQPPLCVKVTFTAETACSPTPSGDYCYVRALDNGVPMSPNGAGFQAIDSEHATAQGHGFEWISEIFQTGQHTYRIQWRVRETPTTFFIDDWTFDVQVYQNLVD